MGTRDPRLTDPDAADFVAALYRERGDWIPGRIAGVAETRGRSQKSRTPDDDAVTTRDVSVPTRDGHIAGRWYIPRDPSSVVVVFFHGGGWVLGDLEMNDGLTRELVARSGALLLSVDYRLAPESPFPAALHDAVDSILWVRDQVDPGMPLVVAGHSAGGNLGAAATHRLLGIVDAQMLLCPVLDSDLDRQSYWVNGDGLLLTTSEMEWYWELYQPDATRRSDPDASPLRGLPLEGLPECTIVVAGADPLRDEAVAYAEAAAATGASVALHLQAGVPHLFLTFPPMPSRDESLDFVGAALRRVADRHRA